MDLSHFMKKVIISIPFYSKAQFYEELFNLRKLDLGISCIEIRFDFLREKLTRNLIADAKTNLRDNDFKMIFAYHSSMGDNPLLFQKLRSLIRCQPDYIDLNANIPLIPLTELADLAVKNHVSIIYSYHNWEETPSLDVISELCEYFLQLLPHFASDPQNILKMVFMAKTSDDQNTVLNFCKKYHDKGFKLISFCMGEDGKMSRIQSIKNGCNYTYAYIGEPTAPGQIHLSDIQKFL
ncbi:MAG: type I 3-dehydroquinate dehydratase [Candidatus Lokiarchaeota archaeon]|nr:type I 3-dehydroquinate dehydratase [Candidatus Lokiarchaeota archaeon]